MALSTKKLREKRQQEKSDNEDDSASSRERRMKKRKSIGPGKPKEKYNRLLTMEMNDVTTTDDLRDAIILFFRLPTIESLGEEDQLRLMKKKYDVVNDYLTPFQQEELFEIAQYMNELESQPMLSTLHKYEKEIEKAFELKPKRVEDLKLFKAITSNEPGDYFCAGCGMPLEYDASTAEWRFWRAYATTKFQHFGAREFLFHNRLCVKLRKAKQVIREMVKLMQGDGNDAGMTIDFFTKPIVDESFRPTKIFTTFDESNLYVKYKENIRYYRQQVKQTDYMSFDIDEGDRWGEVPEAIKYLDLREFALPLAQFAIFQARIKEYAGFWTLLSFLSSHVDTPTMLSLLDENVNILFPMHSAKHRVLLKWLTTICEGSVYPIATCLHIAAFVEEHGPNYFSEEEAIKLYKHFVNMAHSLMSETESEHLMAIMLEMPTNIEGKSVLDIAIENQMLEFLQSPKISNLATTIWYERKIIHPKHTFGNDLTWLQLWQRLTFHPSKFYFSPAGGNIIRVVLYMSYLFQFCLVTYKLKYNIEEEEFETSEWTLWWFNLGQFIYVAYPLLTNPAHFFQSMRNVLELIITCLWIVAAVMEFIFPAQKVRNNEGNKTLEATRNTYQVEAYMGVWAILCILFWAKVIFFLKRLRTVGPLITMISLMVWNIVNFLFLSVIFCIGVFWAMYYVIGGDLENVYNYIDDDDDQPTLSKLGPISSVAGYTFRCFLGQQEWDRIDSGVVDLNLFPDLDLGESDPGISAFRSGILEACVALIEIVGYTLLLNLLVAMLKSTFSEVRARAELEVNYTRVVDSYYSSRGNALLPPPLNHFTAILMVCWFAADAVVTALTGSSRMLNDWYFTPLNKNAFAAGDEILYIERGDGGHKVGTAKGFVHAIHTSEVAVVKVAGRKKLIHKDDIIKTVKDLTVERPKVDASKRGYRRKRRHGVCAARSGRYYCKFCRFQFVGDQVGSTDSVERLFGMYGIQLDPDDLGRVRSMLGETITKTPTMRLFHNAQLCPECSRPFLCKEDHADEVGRVQFVGEIASFWVFCCVGVALWLLMAPLALLSYVEGQSNLSIEKKQQKQILKENAKIMLSEQNDKRRNRVADVFDAEVTNERRIEYTRHRMQAILKRIRESKHDNDQDNIATRIRDEVRERALNLSQAEAYRRGKLLEKTHAEMMKMCDQLNVEIKNFIRYKKKLKAEQYED